MIGVFDSGVGGLTIVKKLNKAFPQYNILYFADLIHLPYGTKSKKTIEEFSLAISKFLIKKGAKAIIVACNTSSAQAYSTLLENLKVPIFDVINPAAEKAISITKNKRVGVIGTYGTIESKAYEKALKKLDKGVKVFSKACPLFVPLVEENFIRRPETKRIVKYYLRELKRYQIDTLILGCTHYPLLKEVIKNVMGSKVKVIDSSGVVYKLAKLIKNDKKLASTLLKNGKQTFFSSDNLGNFKKIAERFLETKIPEPIIVDLKNIY